MLRLRQVALITADLDKSLSEFCAVFGITEAYEDPAVQEFGLRNAILTLGDTYVELLCPLEASVPAARFLERNGGDGGYMLIFQTDDFAGASCRVEKLGIRKTWETNRPNARAFHMHPKDTGGPILSFDEMIPMESWAWAGPDWRRRAARFVGPLRGVEVRSTRQDGLAQRWESLFERVAAKEDGEWAFSFDQGQVRISAADKPGHDVISAVEVETYDPLSVMRAAREVGLELRGEEITLCGTSFRLSPDLRKTGA